jgi:hypothetical protein
MRRESEGGKLRFSSSILRPDVLYTSSLGMGNNTLKASLRRGREPTFAETMAPLSRVTICDRLSTHVGLCYERADQPAGQIP